MNKKTETLIFLEKLDDLSLNIRESLIKGNKKYKQINDLILDLSSNYNKYTKLSEFFNAACSQASMRSLDIDVTCMQITLKINSLINHNNKQLNSLLSQLNLAINEPCFRDPIGELLKGNDESFNASFLAWNKN